MQAETGIGERKGVPVDAVRSGLGGKETFAAGPKPRMLHRSEPTFKLALIWVCLCSAEGSTEPTLPNVAPPTNVC
jgi:hypothetical protein